MRARNERISFQMGRVCGLDEEEESIKLPRVKTERYWGGFNSEEMLKKEGGGDVGSLSEQMDEGNRGK